MNHLKNLPSKPFTVERLENKLVLMSLFSLQEYTAIKLLEELVSDVKEHIKPHTTLSFLEQSSKKNNPALKTDVVYILTNT